MDYEIYRQIIHRYAQNLKRPCKLNNIMDAYSAPADFSAAMEISKSCDLSPLAAATLWCIERSVHARPSMLLGYDGRWSIAQAWAKLSDMTGREDNINKNRFMRWVQNNIEWEDFYSRTQEFLKLCKKNDIHFSQRSLFNAIKLRDNTQKKLEDGSYLTMPKTDFFHVALAIEFTEAIKF